MKTKIKDRNGTEICVGDYIFNSIFYEPSGKVVFSKRDNKFYIATKFGNGVLLNLLEKQSSKFYEIKKTKAKNYDRQQKRTILLSLQRHLY